MIFTAELQQLPAQNATIPGAGQAAAAEFKHALRHQRTVGQSQQTVADVPYRGHGESPAQGSRAAAGIKRSDQMDGIVRMTCQFAAQIAQGRAAGKKNQPGSQGRKMLLAHLPPSGRGEA